MIHMDVSMTTIMYFIAHQAVKHKRLPVEIVVKIRWRFHGCFSLSCIKNPLGDERTWKNPGEENHPRWRIWGDFDGKEVVYFSAGDVSGDVAFSSSET